MFYPTHFLYRRVLSNTLSVRNDVIQQIVYAKMYYPAHVLYENVLSFTFST